MAAVALEPGHPYLRLPLQFAASLRPRLLPLLDEPGLDGLLAERVVRRGGGGHPRVRIWGLLEARLLEADHVVLCAGAVSKRLAAEGGARVPLDAERGYHAMLPHPVRTLARPVYLAEHQFVLAPMEHGIRLTGGSMVQATVVRRPRLDGTASVPVFMRRNAPVP